MAFGSQFDLLAGLSQRVVCVDENGLVRFRGTSPRFVGRAIELAVLDELLGEARAGEPVTVLVCGEAGAGKTRLVSEVAAVVRERGTRTLVGSCTMVGRTSLAFAPFAEAFRPVVRELGIGGGGAGVGWRRAWPALWPRRWVEWRLGTRRILIRLGRLRSSGCSRRCSTRWSAPRCLAG